MVELLVGVGCPGRKMPSDCSWKTAALAAACSASCMGKMKHVFLSAGLACGFLHCLASDDAMEPGFLIWRGGILTCACTEIGINRLTEAWAAA